MRVFYSEDPLVFRCISTWLHQALPTTVRPIVTKYKPQHAVNAKENIKAKGNQQNDQEWQPRHLKVEKIEIYLQFPQ